MENEMEQTMSGSCKPGDAICQPDTSWPTGEDD